MNKKYLLVHIVICLSVGGAIAYFSTAKWLAASFWISAALYINGSIAYVEDGLPGGFDNPDGMDTPEYSKGWRASLFAVKSFIIALALASVGVFIQWYT